MADILRVTSAAVESLLSASSSSSSSTTNKSFACRLKVSGKHVKEISLDEVMRRSQDEGINLAEFLNNQSAQSSAISELPLNTEHRNVSPSKPVMVGSTLPDESIHLVAPSTDSSEYISIIDVGKSLSTTDTQSLSGKEVSQLRKSNSDLSMDNTSRDIDLIPVKELSSKRDTSGSTVSSLKTAEVVDASTPNSTQQKVKTEETAASSNHSSEVRPETPDLSDQPPALPPLHLPQRGLKQGSLTSIEAEKEQPVPELEVKNLKTSQPSTARQMLQGAKAPSVRGAVAVQRVNPPPDPTAAPDQTSQIAAAVAAAVAATTPYHQLKAEIEMKLEKLTAELQKQNASPNVRPDTNDAGKESEVANQVNDSLDITVVPESDKVHDIGLPTPIHPRVAPQPRSHRKPREKSNKPHCQDNLAHRHLTAESLKSQFEESVDEAGEKIGNTQFSDQSKEYELMRKDLLHLLKEAREAKKEIEEMRHAERVQGLRNVVRGETPADVYLEKIKEREDQLFRPRFCASEREYRTPAYLIQARDTLQEIEEKRSLVEKKKYPLDSTYLCDDLVQTPEEERISKKISDILDNIQKEVKSKDPKKAMVTAEPAKPLKRKPKANSKQLEEKKALYNKLRAENQYHNIQANIGRLKEEEKAIRPKVVDSRMSYKSPYQRSGLPQSFPLAPLPRSFPLAPPSIDHHSTPLRTLKHQISTQTSPVLTRETVDTSIYMKPSTRDASVYPAPVPEMLDQQCSPVKVPTQDRAQSYTPNYREDLTYEDYRDPEDFLEVVDLPHTVTLVGAKKVPPKMNKYSAELVNKNQPKKAFLPPTPTDDKVSVMQWLEEAILEKLLTQTPDKVAAHDEVSQILGEDVMKDIANLGLDLSPSQLHGIVSEVMKEQVEERIAERINESPKQISTEHGKSPGDESKPSYDHESFESSTSSTSSSSSSLSPAVTPTLTASEHSVRSFSAASELSHTTQPKSPVLTPPLTPDVSSPDDDTKSATLPDGIPEPVEAPQRTKPPQYFNDTLEQVPLDLTDEVAIPIETVFTPDLTSLQQENTVSLESGTRQPVLEPFTPLNTAQDPVLGDSLISQHPLDITQQSAISQHPLELTGVSENIDIPPVVEPEYSSESSTSVSYTETTDHPISAGEILPGVLQRELAQQVITGPLSEGEWPLSPSSSDLLQLIKDPEIRELLEQRVKASKSPGFSIFHPQDDTIPEEMVSPFRNEALLSDHQAGPSRTLPPAPKRAPVQTPSPLPKTQSVENFETLEIVTPLPEAGDDQAGSPSPPPFMGLQLEDYEFSGESVTTSDKSDNSF